ncbi:MAG TPA: Rnf-Nqr domain containing protein [Steroidobacter sp.]|jgi:electron transport complex protein RnfA|nr:Rnf-Nqr domain containing protein [Steroidobacteraceae bacterium]HLS82196.1 Rnf-Nqr domain containing protein [Steroidobacter sp.]
MSALLLILLSAVLVNAVVAVGPVRWRPFVAIDAAYDSAQAVSLASLVVLPAAVVANWALAKFVLEAFRLDYLRTPLFVAVLLIATAGSEALLRSTTRLDPQQPGFTLLMTANAAALGTSFLAQAHMPTLLEAALFAVGATLGLIVLLLAFVSMHERLRAADTPAIFRGAPLALVTAGLMALGLMGFAGIVQK